MDFDQANAKIHHVHTQWHYDTMVNAGFVPQNLDAVGLVRTFEYHKEVGDHTHIIHVTTGASCDYWSDMKTGKGGYWSDLAPYVKTLG